MNMSGSSPTISCHFFEHATLACSLLTLQGTSEISASGYNFVITGQGVLLSFKRGRA